MPRTLQVKVQLMVIKEIVISTEPADNARADVWYRSLLPLLYGSCII